MLSRNLFASPEFGHQTSPGQFVYLKVKPLLSLLLMFQFQDLVLDPTIGLQDVSTHHLELLISYMYRGEMNCEEPELLSLLATARGLGIKGLSDVILLLLLPLMLLYLLLLLVLLLLVRWKKEHLSLSQAGGKEGLQGRKGGEEARGRGRK